MKSEPSLVEDKDKMLSLKEKRKEKQDKAKADFSIGVMAFSYFTLLVAFITDYFNISLTQEAIVSYLDIDTVHNAISWVAYVTGLLFFLKSIFDFKRCEKGKCSIDIPVIKFVIALILIAFPVFLRIARDVMFGVA